MTLFICFLFFGKQRSSMGSPRRLVKTDCLRWWRYREKRPSCGLTADGVPAPPLTHGRGRMRRTNTEPWNDTLNSTETLLTPTGTSFFFFFVDRIPGVWKSGICHSESLNNHPHLLPCHFKHRQQGRSLIRRVTMTWTSAFSLCMQPDTAALKSTAAWPPLYLFGKCSLITV